MKKETKKSLKNYFIVIGFLWIFSGFSLILTKSDIIIKFLGIITIVFGFMFFYYSFKLYYYLQNSPKTLMIFVMIVSIVGLAMYLTAGKTVYFDLGVFFTWYLIINIKRLSKEITADKNNDKLSN